MPGSLVPRLTIAGMEVPLGGMPDGINYGDKSFERPMGVNAPMMVWCLPPYIADAVLKLSETEIEMSVAGQVTPKKFKRVKVVREQQSDHPLRRYVILSDARWYWPGIRIKANYNLRTATAETQLLNVTGVPIEIDPVTNVVTYAGSSLKNGTSPWTADDVMVDVFGRLGVNFKKLAKKSFGNYAPNDVQLDGPGNVALMQALAAVGGIDVRINDDGDVELVDAFLGSEKDTIEKLIGYSVLRKGVMRWISQPNVQPVKVQVGFDAELEVRGDGWLQAPGAASVDVGNWPTFDNVIQVTDKQLATTDPVSGKSYQAVAGSYLVVDPWFSAVASDTNVPAPPVPVNATWTRTYACYDYLRGLMEFYFSTGQTGGLEPSPAWMDRYRSFRTHFLKTWRLNPKFARLCLPGSVKAVRATLLDPANQTRQPSAVYQDWCRRPSMRGTRDEKNFGWNKHGIPGTPTTQKVGATKTYNDSAFPSSVVALDQCIQSPVGVGLADPISGIFKIGFARDTHDHAAEIVPALVQQLPTNDLDVVNRGAGIAYWEQAQLVTTHRIVLVFTAVPASAPLYFVDVLPQDAIRRLGVQVTVNPKRPVFQLRTGPALQTARIGYADSLRATIQGIFDAKDQTTAAGLLQSLTPVNLAILQDYATASAAVLYAALLDHYEGSQEIAFTPDAMPVGSLQSVTHTMYGSGDDCGKVFTRFDCRHVQPPIQPVHLMERGARAVVYRTPGNWQ